MNKITSASSMSLMAITSVATCKIATRICSSTTNVANLVRVPVKDLVEGGTTACLKTVCYYARQRCTICEESYKARKYYFGMQAHLSCVRQKCRGSKTLPWCKDVDLLHSEGVKFHVMKGGGMYKNYLAFVEKPHWQCSGSLEEVLCESEYLRNLKQKYDDRKKRRLEKSLKNKSKRQKEY